MMHFVLYNTCTQYGLIWKGFSPHSQEDPSRTPP